MAPMGWTLYLTCFGAGFITALMPSTIVLAILLARTVANEDDAPRRPRRPLSEWQYVALLCASAFALAMAVLWAAAPW